MLKINNYDCNKDFFHILIVFLFSLILVHYQLTLTHGVLIWLKQNGMVCQFIIKISKRTSYKNVYFSKNGQRFECGKMQGKFQMQILSQAGHAVPEDVLDRMAEVLATFFTRNEFAETKDKFAPSFLTR